MRPARDCTPERSGASTVLKLSRNTRKSGRRAFAAVLGATLAASACFGLGGQADSPKEQAAALARKAKKASRTNRAADAYLLYSEAAALTPKNARLKAKMESLQSRAALQAKSVPAEEAGGAPRGAAPPPGGRGRGFESPTAAGM